MALFALNYRSNINIIKHHLYDTLKNLNYPKITESKHQIKTKKIHKNPLKSIYVNISFRKHGVMDIKTKIGTLGLILNIIIIMIISFIFFLLFNLPLPIEDFYMAIPSLILTLLIMIFYSYYKVKSYEFGSQNIKTTSLFDFHIGRNIIHLREALLNNLKFIIKPDKSTKNQVNTSLEVKDLKVEFHTPGGIVNAVNGISYKIYKGLTTAIVGESGCGKTVSSMALMKLIPIPPGKIASGEVWYKDTDLINLTEDQLHQIRGKDISIIFQDPMTTLNPYMKLGEQLIESLIYHFSIDRKTAYQKAIQLLERVKLPSPKEKMNSYPYELSGGMRQRVTIAIALACEPEVIIADEPTTDLDVTIQAQILDLLKELRREKDLSIILITHDIALVSEMCENILVMYAGYIVEKGTTKDVLENPKHPYTEKLIESVPFLDKDISRLSSIEGSPPDLINLPPGCPFYKRCDYHKDICKEKMPPERKVTTIDINKSEDNIHTIRCWVDI